MLLSDKKPDKAMYTLLQMSFRTFLIMTLMIPVLTYSQMPQNPIVSPEIGHDNKVTFRIIAPQAEEIKLNGSWLPFTESETLVKGDSGL